MHTKPDKISPLATTDLSLTVVLHGGNVDNVAVSGSIVFWVADRKEDVTRVSMRSYSLDKERVELRGQIPPFDAKEGDDFLYYFEYNIDGRSYSRGSEEAPIVIPVAF